MFLCVRFHCLKYLARNFRAITHSNEHWHFRSTLASIDTFPFLGVRCHHISLCPPVLTIRRTVWLSNRMRGVSSYSLAWFWAFASNSSGSRDHVLLNGFRAVLFEVPHLRILGWPQRLPVPRLCMLLHKKNLPIAEFVYSVNDCLLDQRVQIWFEHSRLPLR
jgi:hypothetical protein